MIFLTICFCLCGLAFLRGCLLNAEDGNVGVSTFAAVCAFFFFAAAYATV